MNRRIFNSIITALSALGLAKLLGIPTKEKEEVPDISHRVVSTIKGDRYISKIKYNAEEKILDIHFSVNEESDKITYEWRAHNCPLKAAQKLLRDVRWHNPYLLNKGLTWHIDGKECCSEKGVYDINNTEPFIMFYNNEIFELQAIVFSSIVDIPEDT